MCRANETTNYKCTGVEYNITTGCPTDQYCGKLGQYGFVQIGNGTVAGGLSTAADSGSLQIEVPSAKPCFLALLNFNRASMTWNVTGQNVSTDLMYLRLPGNTTKVMNNTSGFKLDEHDNIVYMYIGSLKTTA